MSEENVELVQHFYAAWERGDMEWILDHSDPEIEIVQPPEVPDAKSYRGREGLLQSFEDWPKQWEEFRAELIQTIDVDEDRVISVNRQYLRARDIDLQEELAFLHTMQDGRLTRVDMFLSLDKARKAAGLSE